MCNAWNHPDGCDCGFGPPYPWLITRGEQIPWFHSVPYDENYFIRKLKELGLDQNYIGRLLRLYHQNNLPIEKARWEILPQDLKDSIRFKIKDLFGIYEYKTLSQEEKTIYIPIFKMHSPNVKGCEVSYDRRKGQYEKKIWYVKAFCNGFGNDQIYHISNVGSFVCKEGACKLVRMPLHLTITTKDSYWWGEYSHEITEIEASRSTKKENMNIGVKELDKNQCLEELDTNLNRPELYELFEDTTGDPANYLFEMHEETKCSPSLGINAFNIEGGFGVEVGRIVEIRLNFCLISSYDYLVYSLKEMDGIVWKIKRGPNTNRIN